MSFTTTFCLAADCPTTINSQYTTIYSGLGKSCASVFAGGSCLSPVCYFQEATVVCNSTTSSVSTVITASDSPPQPGSALRQTTTQVTVTSTATSTSSPSLSKSTISTNKNSVSGGAAAGIGIGTAIVGAALAALIFFFLFKRYKKQSRQQSGYLHHLPEYNTEIGGQEKAQVGGAITGGALVDSYLPQPAEDDAIKGELSRLRDKIKNHAQSYYHIAPINAQLVDQNKLRDISKAIGVSPANMQELLLEPSSRIAAIRLFIAWVILSRCDGQGQSVPSLLPNEVAALSAAHTIGLESADPRKLTLATKWKVISGALLQDQYGQHEATDDPALAHSIQQAVWAADSVLASFVNSSSPEAASDHRVRNLEGIVRRGSQLAFLLFSQPSSWAFDWTIGGSGIGQPGRLLVFPGLLETVDEQGHVRRPPRMFTEPEVVSGI